jgi:hypothetical protein
LFVQGARKRGEIDNGTTHAWTDARKEKKRKHEKGHMDG